MDQNEDKRFSDLEPTKFLVHGLVFAYGITEIDASFYLKRYIKKFKQGPAVFVPWHKNMWDLWEEGYIRFQPLAPSEVFQELKENDRGFYKEFDKYWPKEEVS